MVDTKYAVELELHTKADGAALKGVRDNLAEINGYAEKSRSALGGLKAVLGEIGSMLAGVFATGAFLNFLRQGTEAAMQEERALRQLSGMAKQFGQDGDAAAAAAKKLGDALQKVGYDDDQVLQDVRELLPLTRDYAQAVSAVSLAYDINAKTGLPVQQALGLLQQLIAGNERGLRAAMRDLGVEATTTGGAIRKIEHDFRGAAAGLKDNLAVVSAAKAELDDLGKAIGGPLSDVLIIAIKWVKGLSNAWAGVGLAAVTAAQTLAYAGRTIVNTVKGDFDKIGQDYESTLNQITAQWQEWKAKFGEQVFGAAGGTADAQAPIKPRRDKGPKETEGKDPWLEKINKRVNAMRDEQEEQARLDAKRAQTGQAALDARARQYQQEQREAGKAAREEEAHWARLHEQRVAIDAAEKRMAEQKAELEKELAAEAVQGAMSTLASAFPEIKAFALAEAIINTYQGVTKALAAYPPPYSFIAAAAQLAFGMAQVAKIESTEPGTSGGATSATTTVRSSAPMVYQSPTTGQRSGATSTTTSTTVNNQNAPTQVVQVNALTGTQAAAAYREFEQGRRVTSRAVNRAIVNRQRTTISPNGR